MQFWRERVRQECAKMTLSLPSSELCHTYQTPSPFLDLPVAHISLSFDCELHNMWWGICPITREHHSIQTPDVCQLFAAKNAMHVVLTDFMEFYEKIKLKPLIF